MNHQGWISLQYDLTLKPENGDAPGAGAGARRDPKTDLRVDVRGSMYRVSSSSSNQLRNRLLSLSPTRDRRRKLLRRETRHVQLSADAKSARARFGGATKYATRTLTGAAMDMAFMEMQRDILNVLASERVPTTPRTCNAGRSVYCVGVKNAVLGLLTATTENGEL